MLSTWDDPSTRWTSSASYAESEQGTEFPFLLEATDSADLINPIELLAEAAVRQAMD